MRVACVVCYFCVNALVRGEHAEVDSQGNTGSSSPASMLETAVAVGADAEAQEAVVSAVNQPPQWRWPRIPDGFGLVGVERLGCVFDAAQGALGGLLGGPWPVVQRRSDGAAFLLAADARNALLRPLAADHLERIQAKALVAFPDPARMRPLEDPAVQRAAQKLLSMPVTVAEAGAEQWALDEATGCPVAKLRCERAARADEDHAESEPTEASRISWVGLRRISWFRTLEDEAMAPDPECEAVALSASPQPDFAPAHLSLAPPPRALERSEPRRVLIAHASIGAGHKAAAKAIETQLKAVLPGVEVVVVDCIEPQTVVVGGIEERLEPPEIFTKVTKTFFLENRGSAMSAFFRLADHTGRGFDRLGLNSLQRLSNATTRLMDNNPVTGGLSIMYNMRFLEEFLLRHKWDLVISTHFFSAMLIARLRQHSHIDLPAVTVVTDYHVHSIWVTEETGAEPGTDKYFVPSSPAQHTLETAYSVPERQIGLTGIPIAPRFHELAKMNPAEAKAAAWRAVQAAYAEPGLHAHLQRRVLLALTTSESVDHCLSAWDEVLAFAQSNPEVKVIAVAGRKPELLAFRDRVPEGLDFTVLGMTGHMPELLTIADMALSKPGGLTVAESLSTGTPLAIVQPWLLDVEHGNFEFLVEAGAGVGVGAVKDLPRELAAVLGGDGAAGRHSAALALGGLQRNARREGRPDAAAEVGRYVEDLFRARPAAVGAPAVCCCPQDLAEEGRCALTRLPGPAEAPDFCALQWGHLHTLHCPSTCDGVGSSLRPLRFGTYAGHEDVCVPYT